MRHVGPHPRLSVYASCICLTVLLEPRGALLGLKSLPGSLKVILALYMLFSAALLLPSRVHSLEHQKWVIYCIERHNNSALQSLI
jgi:hypothetical protein